jgi:hypothetical protein
LRRGINLTVNALLVRHLHVRSRRRCVQRVFIGSLRLSPTMGRFWRTKIDEILRFPNEAALDFGNL